MAPPKKTSAPAGLPPAEYRRVPVALCDPWEDNPRGILTADFERLKLQILRLGVYKPLVAVADAGRFIVLGGNMRLAALKDLGIADVMLSIVAPRTKAERIAYALSDNDRAGFYQDDRLAELVIPHVGELDLESLKVDLGRPVDLKAVIESFGPPVGGGAGAGDPDGFENVCPKCGFKW